MKPRYILAAFIAMGLASYIDSLRGPLLPLLSHRLGLPYAQASWFFIMGNFASVVGLFAMFRFSRGTTDRGMALFTSFLALSSLVTLYLVSTYPRFLVVAAIWGITQSLMGAFGNLLLIHGTDHARRGKYFCGLHTMYGLASLTAPLVVGEVVRRQFSFETAALVAGPLIVMLVGLAVGLKEKNHEVPNKSASKLNAVQIGILILFGSYVAGEVLISSWMVTFLVDYRQFSMTEAGRILSLFFLAMALSRAVCFISLPPRWEGRLLGLSLLVALFGALLGRYYWPPALALAGLVGPFFPLLMARTSRVFPKQTRALTLWIAGGVQLSLMGSQWVMGKCADAWGIQNAYLLPNGFLILACLTLVVYLRREVQHLKSS